MKNSFTDKLYDYGGPSIRVYKKDDVWYALRYDTESREVVIEYFNQRLPILHQMPIRKIVKRLQSFGAAYEAFRNALDWKKMVKEMDDNLTDFDPIRFYTPPKSKSYDLEKVANNFKIPEDFRNFFFETGDDNSYIQFNTHITLADIEKHDLDYFRMNEYLETLKDFHYKSNNLSKAEKAGWVTPNPNKRFLKSSK